MKETWDRLDEYKPIYHDKYLKEYRENHLFKIPVEIELRILVIKQDLEEAKQRSDANEESGRLVIHRLRRLLDEVNTDLDEYIKSAGSDEFVACRQRYRELRRLNNAAIGRYGRAKRALSSLEKD